MKNKKVLNRSKVVGIRGMEFRPIGEVRSVIEEEGIVEAYLTKWNTVDSYNSTFKRGAFKKTFKERQGKIRLLFNHQTLCGKVLEAKEDSVGPFVRCQFNMDTTAGKDAFAHVRAGDVDAFSFGFNVTKSGKREGIREIQEVICMECGPVIFPANEEASIVAFRTSLEEAGRIVIDPDEEEGGEEERAEDFDDTLEDNLLMGMGWRLITALDETLDSCWWNSSDSDEVISKLDEAIAKFQSSYLQWARDFTSRFWDGESRSFPSTNMLISMMSKYGGDLEDIAKRTSFKIEELEELRHGNILPIESRSKLAELPQPVSDAHHQRRCEKIEELCTEFRARGFSKVEKMRFGALLGLTTIEDVRSNPEEIDDEAASELRNLCETLENFSFTTHKKEKENTPDPEK